MSKLTSTIIGLYFAVTVVLSVTVIFSPTFLVSPFTSQPANSLFSGAVKPSLSGKVYSLPLATDTFAFSPLPSPLSKVMSTFTSFTTVLPAVEDFCSVSFWEMPPLSVTVAFTVEFD